MRILVTGGAGFIGSHTVDALLAAGHRVRVLDSLEPPVHVNGARPPYLASDIEFVRGSVNDPEQFAMALEGIEAVFHLAAYQDYLTDFSRFFQVNSVGTALLYELIVNRGLPVERVVIASSQAIYGEGKHLCRTHGTQQPEARSIEQLEAGDWELHCSICGAEMQPEWTGEDASNPHNSYALSKRDQEAIGLKLGARYDIPTVALRYSIVQGPRQSFRNAYSGALRSFTVRALQGQPPVVYEDGNQLRDYVSIQDVVAANLLALTDPGTEFNVFNVGGGRQVTVRELAHLVLECVDASMGLDVSGLYRVGDSRHIVSDISKLRSLGWNPTVAIKDAVRDYVEWASSQPDLQDTFAAARSRMEDTGVQRKVAPTSPD